MNEGIEEIFNTTPFEDAGYAFQRILNAVATGETDDSILALVKTEVGQHMVAHPQATSFITQMFKNPVIKIL